MTESHGSSGGGSAVDDNLRQREEARSHKMGRVAGPTG